MHHQVEAQLQGPLHPGAGERVVRYQDDALPLAQLDDGFQVGQAQQRVARGFHPEHAGILPDRCTNGVDIAEVDEAEPVPGANPPHPLEQAEGTAVEIIAGNDVGAAVEQLQHRGNGRQPGGEGEGLSAAFQIRDAALQGPARGVVGTAVIQPLVYARALLGIGGVGVDRRHDGPGGRVRGLAGVDDAGGEGT
ncbi:hypothetical protein D9M68_655430 [compost metagenome]